MNKIIKVFMSIILLLTMFILYYSNSFEYTQNYLKLEKSEYSQTIFISSTYSHQNEAYEYIKNLLDKYDGDIFYSHESVINSKINYTKYIYLSNETYYEKLTLEEGRFFNNSEFESDKFISTQRTNNPLQIGKLAAFGKNQIFTIKPLYKALDDNILLNGNFTLVLKNENNIESFINELDSNINIDAKIKNNDNLNYYKFPYTILIVLGYFMLCLFVLYEIVYSYKNIAIKKLNGYSNYNIWLEYIIDIAKFQFSFSFIVLISYSLVKCSDLNYITITFILKCILTYIFELIVTFIVVTIPFFYVKKIKIINLLKNMKKQKIVFYFNLVFKFILSIVIITVLSNSVKPLFISLAQYNAQYKNWEKSDQYYITPVGVNMTNDYLSSDEYRQKEKDLYLMLNEDGTILADFSDYLDIYDKEYKNLDKYERIATVNPNYLVQNDIYDVDGNVVSILESESSYIVLVNEKFMNQEKELIDYLQFIKNGCEEKIATQKIQIIWVKDNQKLFTYNFDINIEQGNLVDLNIIRILTSENGDASDYSKLIGYQGNPVKIYIEKNDTVQNYLYPKLEAVSLKEYVSDIYSLNDIVNLEINNSKNLLTYQIIGIGILFFCIILCIYQNVHIFIKNNKQLIFSKKIIGYSFFDKFFKYYIYQILSSILVFALIYFLYNLNILDIFDKKNVVILSILVCVVELIISFISFYILEKKNTVKILKGGE